MRPDAALQQDVEVGLGLRHGSVRLRFCISRLVSAGQDPRGTQMGRRTASCASFPSHGLPAVASIVLLFLLASCGSSTQTVTAPQPVKCGLQLQADSSAFSAAGGTGTLRVTASRECAWSARTDAAWLSLAVPVEGQGDGTLKF